MVKVMIDRCDKCHTSDGHQPWCPDLSPRGKRLAKKNGVRAISIEAYAKHIESGKQATQWMKIYAFLGSQLPCTRSEISRFTGIRMSSVCGRVNELIKGGLIQEHGRRQCDVTSEPAHPVGIKPQPPKQLGLQL